MKPQRQSWGEAERPALWLCRAQEAPAGEPLPTGSSLERGQQGLLEVELQTRAADEDAGACLLLPPEVTSESSRPQSGVWGWCLVVCGGMAPWAYLCSEDGSPRKGCGGGFQRKKNPTCHRPLRRKEPRGTEAVQQGRDQVCKAGST